MPNIMCGCIEKFKNLLTDLTSLVYLYIKMQMLACNFIFLKK